MCLYIKKGLKKKVATKDILVFKVVSKAKDNIVSYFRGFKYGNNKTYKTSISVHKVPGKIYSRCVSTAFYSYDWDIIYKYECAPNIETFDIGDVSLNGNQYVALSIMDTPILIGLFVIPKGATYYLCDSVYVSNEIRYLGKYYSIEDWLKHKNQIIKDVSKILKAS